MMHEARERGASRREAESPREAGFPQEGEFPPEAESPPEAGFLREAATRLADASPPRVGFRAGQTLAGGLQSAREWTGR